MDVMEAVAETAQAKGAKRRVVLVDDHPVFRRGLAQLIDEESDLVTCGEAEDADTAFERVAALDPDAVIVDVSLRGASGLDLTKRIHAARPDLVILVVSMHDEELFAERALRAGASGYVMKERDGEAIIEALRRALAGEVALSEKLASRLLRRLSAPPRPERRGDGRSPLASLSDREIEVFELLGRGLSTREVAGKLKISVKTVETHQSNIKAKLGLRNANQLLRAAVSWLVSDCGDDAETAERGAAAR